MNIYGKVTLLAFCSAIAGSMATVVAVNTIGNNEISLSSPLSTTATGASDGSLFTVSNAVTPPTDFTHAAESTINGVVSIKSYATPRGYNMGGQSQFNDPLFEFFFGQPRSQAPRRQQQPKAEQQQGLGSGVIISKDGYIVTNNHVIDGAERLEVTLNDNSIYNAKVVGSDPSTDVALLKIEADNLPVIPMGDSDALRVGEWVLAVGNPFGFTSTVTTGIVSAKARSVGGAQSGRQMGIESYIQTDAAVNPGNSGGALVNINGELVGINTAIYSQTGNYVGYSFAIPTSIVTKVVTDIKQYGTVQRAMLGVAFVELTPQLAQEKGITAVNDGILVEEVTDRSGAMEAGIKKGDVIVSVNGTKTHNTAQMQGEMSKYRPGDVVEVKYIRDNKEKTVKVTLRNNQGDTKLTKADDYTALGCAFKPLTKEQQQQFMLSGGVQVVGVKDGKFKDAGVKDNFIILDINGQRIKSQSDIEKIYDAIMKSSDPDKVMFVSGIYPTGKKDYYAVPLSE
ncbi:MAG: Do family serine endopeptidase [Muribaculum sp.]|nr:Do family serine endopeptidase [Muribaculaceae bacterium]MCM1080457.1 Do family serine endopeptidase [Muribaculum sp.]